MKNEEVKICATRGFIISSFIILTSSF